MTIPEMMYAAYLPEEGTLVVDLLPTPEPESGEVLVKIHAAALHLEDVFYRNGRYSIQNGFPHVPGSDAAGEIVALGEDVKGWKVDDRVVFTDYDSLGFERDGTHAEYVSVPASILNAIPDDMAYQTAATVGYGLVHAWIGMTYNARIRKRETVVISGASTPLGLAAMDIAKWKEATIIAVDDPAKAKQLREVGAKMVFDNESDDLLSLLMSVTQDASASLVVDLLGRGSLQQAIEMLAIDGRILSLSSYRGDVVEFNLQDLLAMSGAIHTASADLKEGDYAKLLQMVADGKLTPIVDSVMPLSQAVEAYHRIEADDAFGLILLVPDALI